MILMAQWWGSDKLCLVIARGRLGLIQQECLMTMSIFRVLMDGLHESPCERVHYQSLILYIWTTSIRYALYPGLLVLAIIIHIIDIHPV